MITRDGLGIVIGSFALFGISLLGYLLLYPSLVLLIITGIFGVFSFFNLFFFRDPERDIPDNPLAVLAPADGKVVQIKDVREEDYFNQDVQRISIFLSVFNVHVNRIPITGKVDFFAYHAGQFLAAFKEKASLDNEQTVIGMVDQKGHRVLFKQIAGVLARRIICHLQEGEWRKAGERLGMIRYGSRVDIFLAPGSSVRVKIGQRVKGGETIVATFSEQDEQKHSEETVLEVHGSASH